MSLFGRPAQQQRTSMVDGPDSIPPRRGRRTGGVHVTADSSLRHSAVWACTALPADLISTLPIDVYRDVAGLKVSLPAPPIITAPGGEEMDYLHWMRASQYDLERTGNTIGLITETNALNLPARIELQPIGRCAVLRKDGKLKYRIGGKEYAPEKVWHEKVNVVAGMDVGLDPLCYAAWSVGEYLSIVDFVLDWFGGAGVPKARLKNTQKVLKDKEAGILKDRWKAAIENGDLFVHGADWEYNFMQAENAGMGWVEGKRFGLTDICRFYRMPADLIEAAISAPGSITYQSALQRNLQFLILQFGPRVKVRENNLAKLLPKPRYVKINTNALLRLDPETQAKVIHQRIVDRTLTPTEARELYDLPPLTPDQIDEFNVLFGAPRSAVMPAEPPTSKAGAAELDSATREPIHAIASVGQALPWTQPS